MRNVTRRISGLLVFVGSLCLFAMFSSYAKAQYSYLTTDKLVSGGTTRLSCTSAGCTSTVPVLFPAGTAAAPAGAFADDVDGSGTGFFRSAANTFSISTNGVERWVFNPFGNLYPFVNDSYNLGLGGSNLFIAHVDLKKGNRGSESTALEDNTKKAFTTFSVASNSYAGGDIVYTLYCADANDRVSRSGRVPWAAQNTGGTETCATGTASSSGDVTNNAKAFTTVTFTCADGGTNTIQVEVQADCTIATPTTLTIQWRPDLPVVSTVTPQT